MTYNVVIFIIIILSRSKVLFVFIFLLKLIKLVTNNVPQELGLKTYILIFVNVCQIA